MTDKAKPTPARTETTVLSGAEAGPTADLPLTRLMTEMYALWGTFPGMGPAMVPERAADAHDAEERRRATEAEVEARFDNMPV